MIKCVYWGGPVTSDTAVNTGQMRGGFTVAIAGSNGYVTNQIKTPAGYQAGVPYGKFAVNAPYDAQGYNTVSQAITSCRTTLTQYVVHGVQDFHLDLGCGLVCSLLRFPDCVQQGHSP
jgi:hypothetical protein